MNIRVRTFVMAVGIACATAASAQVSTYYTTFGTSAVGTTYEWQGGAQVLSFANAAAGEMPIVVGNFGSGLRIREAVGQPASGAPEQGDEYLTNGTPTGFHNFWNSGNSNITGYDAAFDGSSIYMVDWSGGGVYRYDNNYNGRTFMFNAHASDIGITYDSGTNTIWTSGFSGGLVQQWSMNGTAMASFTAAGGSAAALAYDPLDQTLWMSDGFNGTNILHYDRQGNLLGTVTTNHYLLGGEMAAVPEPASLIVLGAGLLIAVRRRRQKA